jgi:hypothetical protein
MTEKATKTTSWFEVSILTLCVGLGLTTTAAAVDGVIEINATKASVGGVTAGDAAGYPVTLSQSGSYVLTGNLRASLTFATPFIDVTADNVTIDMNGYAIECRMIQIGGPAIPCTLSSGNGIEATEFRGLTVLNGTIKWMGQDGVAAADGARLEGMNLVENGRYGAFLGEAAVVVETRAGRNGDAGLRVSAGSTISQSAIFDNGKGIVAAGGVHVVQNAVYANTGLGLSSINGGDVAIGMNSFWGNNGAGAETDGSVFLIGSNQCGIGFCP